MTTHVLPQRRERLKNHESDSDYYVLLSQNQLPWDLVFSSSNERLILTYFKGR